jgi:iron complex outermembrane recepter protein
MTRKLMLLTTTALAASLMGAVPGQSFAQDDAIEEVVVTGSYIRRRSQIDSPSPISVLGSEYIENIGAKSIADVTQTLTINTGAQNNPDAFTQNFSTGTSNINLRGLGVSSTLILLNGKRQVSSGAPTDQGALFTDTSSLVPMIAIERVEILEDGAAALYGTDAVAGVVNFITRNDFEGFEVSADVQSVTENTQTDLRVQAIAGAGNERTHVMVSFSYFNRTPLTTAERRQPGSLNPLTGDFSNAGQPGTFLLPTLPVGLSPALQGLWSAVFDSAGLVPGLADAFEPQAGLPAVAGALLPAFADPNCANGENSVVPATFPIGLCRLDFGTFFNLVPQESRTQGYMSFTHELSENIEFYGEASFARNRAERGNTPSFPFVTAVPLPKEQPFNPFGTDVLFIGRPIGSGGPFNSKHNSDTLRMQMGARGDINVTNTWTYDISYTYASNDYFVAAGDTLVDRYALAVAGFGGTGCNPVTGLAGQGSCQFFNPFGSSINAGSATVGFDTTDAAGNPITVQLPLANSQDVINDFTALLTADVDVTTSIADVVFTGDIGEVPAGTVGMAVGGQFRHETHAANYDNNANKDNFLFLIGNPDFADARNIYAVFAESAVPITEDMELQAAVRYTDYGQGVGDSVDPKVALIYHLSENMVVRGSFSTAFRAPSIFQQSATQTSLVQLSDTLAGQAPSPGFKAVRTFGNANLKPETSTAWNAGITWRPNASFEFNVDYWRFDFSDVIIQENPQAILNANPLDPRIQRGATGGLERINTGYVNAASLDTDGFDFGAAYTHEVGDAVVRLGAEATYIVNYDLVDPQAGAISGAGNRNRTNFGTSAPRWRGNLNAQWNWDIHQAGAYLRYISGYDDDQTPGNKIDNWVSVDLQYAITLKEISSNFDGLRLSGGVLNAFDKQPPLVATNGGFDSKVHDPRGRMFYVRLTQAF